MFVNLYISGIGILLTSALVPLLFIVKGKRFIRTLSLLLAVLSCIILIIVSILVFCNQSRYQFDLYTITSFFTISCVIDRLSAFFIILISVVALSVVIYSFNYVEHGLSNTRKNVIVSLMSFFILSMIMVVVSFNMVSFLIFWEIMSTASFFLVMTEYEKPATGKAGLYYFIMTQLSTVFIIFGFVLMATVTGSFDFKNLPPARGSVRIPGLAR